MFCGLYIVDGHEQPEPSLEILQSLLEYTLQWWPWPGAKGESATVTFSFFLQIVIITPSFYLMWTCQILGHGSRRYPQGHKMYIWSERTNSTLESVGVFFARCIFVQHTNEDICKTCKNHGATCPHTSICFHFLLQACSAFCFATVLSKEPDGCERAQWSP